jgi:putative PIN family toxin of toxin-antitoxin system
MLDTNILVSSVLKPNGVPNKAYEKAVEFPNILVISDVIIEELIKTFSKKFPGDLPHIYEMLSNMRCECVVTPTAEVETEILIRDIKDRPILRAAIHAGVDIFVTGDKDFLESNVETPLILTASEFVNGKTDIFENQPT